MIKQDYNWLKDNYVLLGNVTMTRPQLQTIFDIYNRITGENKPVTSCGRCVLNIKKRLKFEIEKYENLQSIRNKDR